MVSKGRKLTDEEYLIIKDVPKKYKWLVRNGSGDVYASVNPPKIVGLGEIDFDGDISLVEDEGILFDLSENMLYLKSIDNLVKEYFLGLITEHFSEEGAGNEV